MQIAQHSPRGKLGFPARTSQVTLRTLLLGPMLRIMWSSSIVLFLKGRPGAVPEQVQCHNRE